MLAKSSVAVAVVKDFMLKVVLIQIAFSLESDDGRLDILDKRSKLFIYFGLK